MNTFINIENPWDFPGKNTGVGCHFLLQEIFLTQGLNPGLLHCRQTLYHLSHQGSPFKRHNITSNHTDIIIHNSKCFPFPFASNLGVVQAAWSCGAAIRPCQSIKLLDLEKPDKWMVPSGTFDL